MSAGELIFRSVLNLFSLAVFRFFLIFWILLYWLVDEILYLSTASFIYLEAVNFFYRLELDIIFGR